MNICVCVKQVPDTSEIKIDEEKHVLIRQGVPSIMNPFDTYALEAAVRMREQQGGKVVVVSMGPRQAEEVIRESLSVGADTGYLVSGKEFGGSDTLATSYILSQAIKEIEKREQLSFDLILCGKQAADGDTAQVGPELAEHLGLPQITCALDINIEENCTKQEKENLCVKREWEIGYDMIVVRLPALVTVAKLSYEPRYPTLSSKLAAKKANIPILSIEELASIDSSKCGLSGSPTRVRSTYTPCRKKENTIFQKIPIEEAAMKVAEVVLRTMTE